MAATPGIKMRATVSDRNLQNKIVEMSRATGRTVKEETKIVFKGLIRDALNYTMPNNAKNSGKGGQRAGEGAIDRDLKRMGFVVKELKKETAKANYADPDAYHHERLVAAQGGKPTMERRFYVSPARYKAMRKRLIDQVGRLASGWATAAAQLGVPVPAWIRRHSALGRGTSVQIVETDAKITMKVTNHFPNTASDLAAETRRQMRYLKEYAIGRLKRQLPVLLKKNLRSPAYRPGK